MGEVTFKVKCAIQYMDDLIFFGVIGQCLKVKPYVTYENLDGQLVMLESKTVNDIRLKPVCLDKDSNYYLIKN